MSTSKSKTSVSTVTNKSRSEARKKMFLIGDGSVSKDIFYMVKSRFRILYICTPEESRVMHYFRYLSKAEAYEIFQWDMSRGLLEGHSMERAVPNGSEVHLCPEAVLRHILDRAKSDHQEIAKEGKPQGSIFVLLDYHRFLLSEDGQSEGSPLLQRLLKDFFQTVSAVMIVIVAPVLACPTTLEKEITVVDFPFPSPPEITSALDRLKKQIPAEYPKAHKQIDEKAEDLIKAVSGLTLTEAENAFAKSLVQTKEFDIDVIIGEKKQAIRKSGVLEYREPRYSLSDIGGLDVLCDWVITRKLAFQDDARSYGLPMPRGILICGFPGSGKSMVCDALANEYQMPLLRLDFGAIFASHVGDSEANVRKCLRIAESVAPAILWLDEVEKAVSGSKGSEFTDGGVTARVFGTLLTWMQEKEKMVFMACTANDVHGIPPEFMRAGRFDEIFFIDLPNKEQRYDVTEKLVRKKKRNPDELDIYAIVDASDNYSPAEIEKGIDNALFVAFADGKRGLRTEDIVDELKAFSPLYNTRKEEMESLRAWALGDGAGGRARLANSSSIKKKPKKTKTKRTPKVDHHRIVNLDLEV